MKRDGNFVKRQDGSSCALETAAPTNPPGGGGGGGGGGSGPTTTSPGSGTTTIPSSPSPTAVLIVSWDSAPYELTGFSNWWYYTPAVGASYTAYDAIGSTDAVPNFSEVDVPFPDGTFDLAFEVLGMSGCVYSGTATGPGLFTCPGFPGWVQCVDNSQNGDSFDCDGEEGVDTTFPKVSCFWS
jgi:hypothetical protein